MWVKTKKGRIFNLDSAFDIYANDPRNEVSGRTYTNWTVVVRGGGSVGVLALCESQADAEATCAKIWDAIRQKMEMLELS